MTSPVPRVLADVTAWPLFASSVIYARALEVTDEAETFDLWLSTTAGVRRVALRRRTVEEVTELGFGPGPGAPTTVLRYHADTRVIERDTDGAGGVFGAAITRLLDELTESAALPGGPDDWVYTFEDVVRTHGRVLDLFDFLRRLELWPQRLAHVHDVDYTEDADGVQTVRLTVVGPDGTRHPVPSIRLCLGGSRVVYKPATVPPIARAHLGQWSVSQHAGEVTVSGRHSVLLDPAGITRVLGAGAGLDQATRLVRSALGAHSLATLEAAKTYAESRSRAYEPDLSWDRLGAS